MLVIVSHRPDFTTGYFTGFDAEGSPRFQSFYKSSIHNVKKRGKRVKQYRGRRRAEQQLQRIKEHPVLPERDARLEVVPITALIGRI